MVAKLSTDCESLVGQDLDGHGGAHMVCRLVPAGHASFEGVLGHHSWDPGATASRFVPVLIALSCRGNRHRTKCCQVHPHDPWHLTQRSRVGTPTSQVVEQGVTVIERSSPQRSTQTRSWAPDLATPDQQQQTVSMGTQTQLKA